MNTCVVIPVYNSPYISEVIKDVQKYDYTLIVVDDGSDKKIKVDDSAIILLSHPENMGKGEAIITGAKKAKELGFESFVVMDADKQHIASQIEILTKAYRPDTIVVGCRNFESENIPKSSIFGRKFSNFWVNLEIFKSLKDTQSGFRMYPISILSLKTKKRKFDFEIEVLVLHSFSGGNIKEVDIECYYPPFEQRISQFDKVKDNVRLSKIHMVLIIQRFLLLRGFFWN